MNTRTTRAFFFCLIAGSSWQTHGMEQKHNVFKFNNPDDETAFTKQLIQDGMKQEPTIFKFNNPDDEVIFTKHLAQEGMVYEIDGKPKWRAFDKADWESFLSQKAPAALSNPSTVFLIGTSETRLVSGTLMALAAYSDNPHLIKWCDEGWINHPKNPNICSTVTIAENGGGTITTSTVNLKYTISKHLQQQHYNQPR